MSRTEISPNHVSRLGNKARSWGDIAVSSEQRNRREAPWSAGFRAARANLVPGLLVQAVMVAVLAAYLWHTPTREFLDEAAALKERLGYGFSIIVGVVAGGVMPELLRWTVLQRMRWTRRNFQNLLFAIPFWSSIGVLVDWFYRRQAEWFGDAATLEVVVPQVLVDQFVFTPLLTAPLTAILYDWKDSGYRWSMRFFTRKYYLDSILPTLVAIWCVWIPIVTVLYTLPETVQIPLYALALTLWVMLYTWMSEERAARGTKAFVD